MERESVIDLPHGSEEEVNISNLVCCKNLFLAPHCDRHWTAMTAIFPQREMKIQPLCLQETKYDCSKNIH